MKKSMRFISMACTVAVMSAMFVGCSSSKKGEEKTAATSKAVTLKFWEDEDNSIDPVLDQNIKEFQAKYSNITVKRTHYGVEDMRKNFTTGAMAGKAADVALIPNDNVSLFVAEGIITPLDDLMGKDFFNKYDKNILSTGNYNGKQYMLNDRFGNELFLVYNKKLVKEAPKTWEELVEVGQQLKKDGKVQYPVAVDTSEPFFMFPFLGAFDVKIFDNPSTDKPNPTMDSAQAKDWYTWMKKNYDDGVFPKVGTINDVAMTLFQQGKAPFYINGPWGFAKYDKMDFGFAPIPSINGKDPAPTAASKGYVVSKASIADAAQKDAIKKFVEFMNSKEAQIKMVAVHGQMPSELEAQKSDAVTKNTLISGQAEILKKSVATPLTPRLRCVWDAARTVELEVLTGKTKAADAPARIQKLILDDIKKLSL